MIDNKNDIISLAIVTYNNSNIIKETLQTILDFSEGINLKVFLIDNNSSDSTVNVVSNYFPNVSLIKLPQNIGFGAAHNFIINNLNSKYHAIINPDIRFKNNTLGMFFSYMEKNPDIALAIPKFYNEDGTEQFTPKLQPNFKYMISSRFSKLSYFNKLRKEYTMQDKKVTKPVDVGFCSGCFMFLRTEVFKTVGGFDERYFLYSEDADLTRKVKKYGRTVYNPDISVVHLWERGYLKSKKLFLIQIKSMIMYLWKWRGKD